jgi:hypothetical protein
LLFPLIHPSPGRPPALLPAMAAPITAAAAARSPVLAYSPALRAQVGGFSRIVVLCASRLSFELWILIRRSCGAPCSPVTVGNRCGVVSSVGIFPQAKNKLPILSTAADSEALSGVMFGKCRYTSSIFALLHPTAPRNFSRHDECPSVLRATRKIESLFE